MRRSFYNNYDDQTLTGPSAPVNKTTLSVAKALVVDGSVRVEGGVTFLRRTRMRVSPRLCRASGATKKARRVSKQRGTMPQRRRAARRDLSSDSSHCFSSSLHVGTTAPTSDLARDTFVCSRKIRPVLHRPHPRPTPDGEGPARGAPLCSAKGEFSS